jgi:hypothetical protein
MKRYWKFYFFSAGIIVSFFAKANDLSDTTINMRSEVVNILHSQVMKDATWALSQQPVTVTASHSQRSAGGLHDFFSEADYFWPNPVSADSPYIQKDGLSNPDNFTAHREAMIRFSKIIGALASAYILTNDDRYVRHAVKHCNAWFTDSATYMIPSLLYAQAIKGRTTGRSWGIIDMIQMIEVAKGLMIMEHSKAMPAKSLNAFKNWFEKYLQWITTYPAGIQEMNAQNNHATCWAMQVAVFAKFAGNNILMELCKSRFKNIFLPNQMDANGSFPLELKRTKPYGYSLFNLDAMATICQTLSTKEDDLWNYTLADGRTMKKAVAFMYPFIQDKNTWNFQQDVMYWDEWPVAQPALLFAAVEFKNDKWFEVWKINNHAPTNKEVIRNLPVRNPLLWLDSKMK